MASAVALGPFEVPAQPIRPTTTTPNPIPKIEFFKDIILFSDKSFISGLQWPRDPIGSLQPNNLPWSGGTLGGSVKKNADTSFIHRRNKLFVRPPTLHLIMYHKTFVGVTRQLQSKNI
jgi:hypothetical protein